MLLSHSINAIIMQKIHYYATIIIIYKSWSPEILKSWSPTSRIRLIDNIENGLTLLCQSILSIYIDKDDVSMW